MDCRIPVHRKAQTGIVDVDFETAKTEAGVDGGGDEEQSDGDDDACLYHSKHLAPKSLPEAH